MSWNLYTSQVIDSLEDIIRDLVYVVEGEIQPGNVLGDLDEVKGKLVQTLGVHKVVVGETNNVAVVPADMF